MSQFIVFVLEFEDFSVFGDVKSLQFLPEIEHIQ